MEETRQQHHRSKRHRRENRALELNKNDDRQEDAEEKGNNSDGIPAKELPKHYSINPREIRKDVQCPICLGIIKKARTVMECVHSFCKECIDKAMRLGNNECPTCRTHCASRRSLRDNPVIDEIIAYFSPNIDKFEKEEATIAEEEQTHNKQIQESIARIHQLQSEAIKGKLVMARDSTSSLAAQTPYTETNASPRRARNRTIVEIQDSLDENDKDINYQDGNKHSSSADDCGPIVEPRTYTRRRRVCTNGHTGNEEEQVGAIWNIEGLKWGQGGARSQTRGASSSLGFGARLPNLIHHLGRSKESDEFDVHVEFIPLEKTPSLLQPQICCCSSLTVKYLYEHVAREMSLRAEDIEILLAKESVDLNDEPPLSDDTSAPTRVDLDVLSGCRSKKWLWNLDGEETLDDLKKNIDLSSQKLTFAYRQKRN